MPVFERVQEPLFLGLDDQGRLLALGPQFRVPLPHQLHDLAGEPVQERLGDARPVGQEQRPAQDAAQHVAARLVRGNRAVGNREGQGPGMVNRGIEEWAFRDFSWSGVRGSRGRDPVS